MSDKKINLVFDVTMLIQNNQKNCFRSGIFFTAVNILKELSKVSDFKISLYCRREFLYECCKSNFLQQFNFPIINKKELSSFEYKYKQLKEKRNELKKSNKYFHKILLSIAILPLSALTKLFSIKTQNLSDYNEINIFFSPQEKIPEFIQNLKHIQKYTLLYDTIPSIFPQYFTDLKNPNYWYLQLISSINSNDYYFAISEHTKQDFIKYVPTINPEHITTTLLACSEAFRPEPEKTKASLEKYNLPTNKKYIFSLCTLEPRKNLIRAVKTFIQFIEKNKIDDLVFILGGGSWKGFIEKLENEVPDFDKYRDKIIKAGYIDDEDLAPLYSGAEWFVYTSQYEGFGLPPLEAMSCGCPVITSNNSSLPEVVGDAGIMIDWDSDEQHVQAYEKYYFNSEIRNDFAKKGLERAKLFSWEKCVSEMVSVIKKEYYKVNV